MKSAILIWSFLLPAWLFAQMPRIDALRIRATQSIDSSRIDILNELSLQFMEQSSQDSALHYANIAYQESKSLLYKHGMAKSLSIQGNMKTYFESNFIEAEKLDKQSIAGMSNRRIRLDWRTHTTTWHLPVSVRANMKMR